MSADSDYRSATAAAMDADRAQADYFRAELSAQIAELDAQIARRLRALQAYRTRTQAVQIQIAERGLRQLHTERDAVARMRDRLDTRFPST